LKSKMSDFNNVKAYVVLYHEATVMLHDHPYYVIVVEVAIRC
jgi:hypothetical protein